MVDKKKKLGIDMDCVISETTNEVVNLYNYYTGENLKMENITEWDFSKVVPEIHKNLIFDLFFNDKLWKNVRPLKDSIYYMQKLYDEYDMYIVTATYLANAEIKKEWLSKYFPFIKEEDIIIAHNKQMIGVDLLVDDNSANLIDANYSKILLDYPWNENIDDKKYGILRVHNWKEIYKGIHILLPIKSI